jgi:CheY-like chemotaxis protein
MYACVMSVEQKSLLLIADCPEGAEIIKQCLSPMHDLVLVHNLTAATRLIANVDFDAVIAGTHFDDSRMIELLRAVRAEARYADKPFIAVRVLPTTMSVDLEANAKQMATVLGATAFITVDQFPKDVDFSEELRALVTRFAVHR